jgi:2,4-dienoyl-CoA reductase-like NADH-dependent reductase (Old Yellow Enzyme family)
MVTDLPLLAVGGFRSRKVMEQALLSGAADFISLSRPLIREPDLPVLFKKGEKERSSCLSANNCWPENAQEGISCKCPPLSEEGSS